MREPLVVEKREQRQRDLVLAWRQRRVVPRFVNGDRVSPGEPIREQLVAQMTCLFLLRIRQTDRCGRCGTARFHLDRDEAAFECRIVKAATHCNELWAEDGERPRVELLLERDRSAQN